MVHGDFPEPLLRQCASDNVINVAHSTVFSDGHFTTEYYEDRDYVVSMNI